MDRITSSGWYGYPIGAKWHPCRQHGGARVTFWIRGCTRKDSNSRPTASCATVHSCWDCSCCGGWCNVVWGAS